MTITFTGLIRTHGGGGGGGETTTWDPEGTTWDTTWAPGGTTFETTPENTTTFDPEETTIETTGETTAVPEYRITCVTPLVNAITEDRIHLQNHGTSKYYMEIKFHSGFSRTQDENIIGTGPRDSFFESRIIRVNNNNNEETVEQVLSTGIDQRSFTLDLNKPTKIDHEQQNALADNVIQSENLRHEVLKVEKDGDKVTFEVQFWAEGSLNGQQLPTTKNKVEHVIEFVSHQKDQPPT
jgi:hypothetical protein